MFRNQKQKSELCRFLCVPKSQGYHKERVETNSGKDPRWLLPSVVCGSKIFGTSLCNYSAISTGSIANYLVQGNLTMKSECTRHGKTGTARQHLTLLTFYNCYLKINPQHLETKKHKYNLHDSCSCRGQLEEGSWEQSRQKISVEQS